MISASVGDHRTQRRRIHHQRSIRRNHRRKASRKAAEPALERIAAAGVEQGNLDTGAAVVDFAQNRFEAEAVPANVGFGPDLGVDRYHVALARGLDAEAAEEQQHDRSRLDAAVEAIERAPHAVDVQIFSDLDIEAVTPEFVGDVAGIVDRLLERRLGVGILGVADHQRKPVGMATCGDRSVDQRNRRNQGHEQCEANSHVTAAQPARRRLQLAPRRPYSTQTALSNRARKPSTPCGVADTATIDAARRAPGFDLCR